jgi:hypothetical protein
MNLAVSDSLVLGSIDRMERYSHTNVLRAGEIVRLGSHVEQALAMFNAGVDPAFRVDGSGRFLASLGLGMADLDAFVGDVAERFRSAERGTLGTIDQAQLEGLIELRRSGIESLSRTWTDTVLATLVAHFDEIDTVRKHKRDGIISTKDLQEIAKTSKDRQLVAAATWLLADKNMIRMIDRSGTGQMPGQSGITRNDLREYASRMAAVRLLRDNWNSLDTAHGAGPDGSKPDGKISAKDLQAIIESSPDPQLRDAARAALDDPRVLGDQLLLGDRVATRKRLNDALEAYGEPTTPLPPTRNGLVAMGCATAGFFSYMSYVDMVNAARKGQDNDAVRIKVLNDLSGQIKNDASKKAVERMVADGVEEATAKAIVGKASIGLSVVATGVDIACRVTDPRREPAGAVNTPKKARRTPRLGRR